MASHMPDTDSLSCCSCRSFCSFTFTFPCNFMDFKSPLPDLMNRSLSILPQFYKANTMLYLCVVRELFFSVRQDAPGNTDCPPGQIGLTNQLRICFDFIPQFRMINNFNFGFAHQIVATLVNPN